ncbi:CPBP family intramembrane glutamic endopeptidase [Brachybacterium sp.]|uniref:CPBP family intramembrane glutamic endopeptidase n=1 Tax=Brachybacterium sp. TaxID=1891286 RepID=UPI003F8F71B7
MPRTDELSVAQPRLLAAAAWRIALAMLPLGAGLAALAPLLPAARDVADPMTLTLRIAAGVALSALTLAVILLLLRLADRRRMRDAGLTSPRAGWRLAVWGALLWTVPAAATFGVLGLLGAPLTVTVPGPDLARTVLLLLCAVLAAEAIPEEAVFRGYVTYALGTVARGWWVIIAQALLFTLFGALLRQSWNLTDLSLFFTMGIGFGWLRLLTGSIWMSIGFHAAFQTGAQLVLTQEAIAFAGGTGTAMLALGIIPFTVAAAVTSALGIPRAVHAGSRTARHGLKPPAT